MDFAQHECKIPEHDVVIPVEVENYEFLYDERELFGGYECGGDDEECEELVIDVCFE